MKNASMLEHTMKPRRPKPSPSKEDGAISAARDEWLKELFRKKMSRLDNPEKPS
jgi:hypothetical protein